MLVQHRTLFGDARDLRALMDGSVQLVVTSPPYPMIALWDDCFAALAPDSAAALARADGPAAFEAQHQVLDAVWAECARLLCPGGLMAVNIGDATRKLGEEFRLWSNHSRILSAWSRLGLSVLPDILWRKPTNAPNKFMGSGMLPAGAYVTYEHEYILIGRKGLPRAFSAPDKARRRRSAFFWEERNAWFSDLWMDLPGTRQRLDEARARSAAFPLALAARLINMFSLQNDLVLDPFLGTGTTALAALASGRDSVGVELDPALAPVISASLLDAVEVGNGLVDARLSAHAAFAAERAAQGRPLSHHNAHYDFPVMTAQETDLVLPRPLRASVDAAGAVTVEHGEGRTRPVLLSPAP